MIMSYHRLYIQQSIHGLDPRTLVLYLELTLYTTECEQLHSNDHHIIFGKYLKFPNTSFNLIIWDLLKIEILHQTFIFKKKHPL